MIATGDSEVLSRIVRNFGLHRTVVVMIIKRETYLQKLIGKNNGQIKVLTGIRRCGKSYLLDPIFRNHLKNEGIPADHIIKIELDRASN